MPIFSLSYKLNKPEDCAAIHKMMKAWQGLQVADATWILKRNDGCTCQTVIDDLLEHISADNDISVVELKAENNKPQTAFNI